MARSRSIGSIYASLSLKDKSFTSGMSRAAKQINVLAGTALQYGSVAAAAMAAALAAGTKRALDQADALGDLSVSTGVAVSDLMGLRQAYKEGGLSADAASKDIGKMQKSLSDAFDGDRTMSDTFRRLGLDIASLMALSPADQFERIGKAIMGVENMAQRVAAARDIFGRSGSGLISVFDNVEEVRQSLGKLPEITEKFANGMGRANDLIGRLPIKSDQFFMGFTAGVIGEMLPALEKTNGFDFTELGENLGRSLAFGLESLTDGKAWELFTLHGQQAMLGLMNNSITNTLAAEINSMMDAITGEHGPGRGYYEAGEAVIAEQTEKMIAIQDRIDDIVNSVNRGVEMKRNAAAATPAGAAPVATPLPSVRDLESDTQDTGDLMRTAQRDVNDYQKRGLSLFGSDAMKPENRTIDRISDVVAEIRDLFKRGGLPHKSPVW